MSRICIVRHYYYPEDPRSRREAEALAAAGHEVDILTLRHPNEPAREVINGVNVRRLPVEHYRGSLPKYAYEYGAFFFLAFMVLTARLFRRRYDVVQVNSLPDFLVFAAVAYKLAGVPVVIDMHECTPELFCTKYGASPSHPVVRLLAWIEQRSLGFADQVITCTPQQRTLFASRGTPAEKIAVVLNAANSAIFRPRTTEPVTWKAGGPFELVAHGLIAERYGLDTMVKAVALLANDIPGVRLHVYGKGDYQPELEALVQELGVADRVLIHGFVPEEELLEGIARAHVGVIAAKRDTFRDMTHTQKMYEYVAMHKPVVIAETPAVRTHFDDSCFQFFTSNDPANLARALRELYYRPERALTMIASASSRYRAYDWDAQRHVYSDAVLNVGTKRAPRPVVTQRPQIRVNPPNLPTVAVGRNTTLASMDWSGMVAAMEDRDVYTPSVSLEATPALASIDWGGMVAAIEDRELYIGGKATPNEDGGI